MIFAPFTFGFLDKCPNFSGAPHGHINIALGLFVLHHFEPSHSVKHIDTNLS